jgi:chromosomal replication initiator protein
MNIEHIPTRAEIKARRERLGCYAKPAPEPEKRLPAMVPQFIIGIGLEDYPEAKVEVASVAGSSSAAPIWFRVIDDRPVPTMHNIVRAVAKYYGRTPTDLRSKSREYKCVFPRMVSVYIARSITELSYPQIGKFLGGRDHSTSMHSFQKIESLIAAGDLELKATIDEIVSQFAVPE